MKKNLLLLFTTLSFIANAQIAITSADLHAAGDNILVSRENPATAVDILTTGANQTWDFSYLIPVAQDTISFLDVTTTGAVYSFYFANFAFNPNRSNIAAAVGNIPAIPGSPITVTDPYSFYYKSTTEYKQQGLGATISGLQTPIALNTKDIVYNFPINYLDIDSSYSDWNLALAGLGYYGYSQKRINNIDGWGSLITPYGTFNTLRVVTQINGTDTLFLDTIGSGFSIPRTPFKEYKWFGLSQKIPLLQINTTLNFGNENVTSIVYRDSLRLTSINNLESNNEFIVYPNPSIDIINVSFPNSVTDKVNYEIYNSTGQMVLKNKLNTSGTVASHAISIKNLNNGVYTILIYTKTRNFSKRFSVIK